MKSPLLVKGQHKRWPWYLLLTLVLLGLMGSGAWALLVRPRLQQSIEAPLQHSFQLLVSLVPVARDVRPGLPFLISQDQINASLQPHTRELAPLMHLQVSFHSGVVEGSFTAYGLGNTVQFGLGIQGGKLVAQQVKGSGLLSWVEAESDLTHLVEELCSQLNGKVGRPLGLCCKYF
jgi:hypothetical protein